MMNDLNHSNKNFPKTYLIILVSYVYMLYVIIVVVSKINILAVLSFFKPEIKAKVKFKI